MIDFEEIVKYRYLNVFTQKVSLKRICAQVYGMSLQAAWLVCNIDGKKFFNWNYLERRQLFLELIAYHLEHKTIKFGNIVDFAEEPFEWDESTSIKDTITYFEKGFSKTEEIFVNGKRVMPEMYGNINIDSKEGYQKVISYPSESYEINMYIYFFGYCPTLAYWNEKSRSWYWTD